MQVIFELEHRSDDPEAALRYHLGEAQVSGPQADFALNLVRGTLEHRDVIDEEIASASLHWTLEQMAGVERSVLRLCTYELLFCPEVPPKAAVNESIELAKTFGGDESGRFVNGILGRVMQRAAEIHANGDGAEVGGGAEVGEIAEAGS